MSRYNHRLIEKKWNARWQQSSSRSRSAMTAAIPDLEGILTLENVRLLLLTDFYGWLRFGEQPLLNIVGIPEKQLPVLAQLGLRRDLSHTTAPELILCARDYSFLVPQELLSKTQLIGRYFTEASFAELFPDFGADALRLYFLQLGPAARDYHSNWHGLVGTYRFLQQLWLLAREPATTAAPSLNELTQLQTTVTERLALGKSHTALAAIRQFIRTRSSLSSQELLEISILLRPFIPHLAAEIFHLMTAV